MLKYPYKFYDDLYIYNVAKKNIKINDEDLIGVWEEEDTLLLFFHKNKDELIENCNFKLFFSTKIKYNEWESGKFIKPFRIGEYYVEPVWEASKNSANDNRIVIDPSVVFGSGFHPTTRMIMEAFDELTVKEKFTSCIDLGCGTGILGILASKKGINKVFAVDNNNLSYEVALKNRKLNNVFIDVAKGDIFDFLPYNYDIVFANLYYHLLHDLFANRGFWQAEYYFISGFIEKMEREIIEKIQGRAEIVERKSNDGWVMLMLRRKI